MILKFALTVESAVKILTNPAHSYHPLLWFIHALFIIFIFYPLLLWILRKDWLVLIAAIILLYVPWPSFMALRTVFISLPYFAAGYCTGRLVGLDLVPRRQSTTTLIISAVAFAALFAVYKKVTPPLWSIPPLRFLRALSGSLACLAAASLLTTTQTTAARLLAIAGFYSMSIYLLHTLFLSVVRISFYQMVGIGHALFLPVAILAVTTGMVLPGVIEKYVLRRYKLTRRLILGLTKPALGR